MSRELDFALNLSGGVKKRKIATMENRVHQLANSVRNRFEKLPELSSKCCIYRIPQTLKIVNKQHFKPCFVSIGPFHYGNNRLQQSMKEQKLRYLNNFLRRNKGRSLNDYLGAIRQWEGEARECYVETIKLSSEEFVEMVLVDAVFVIEFLLLWYFDNAEETDRVFSKPSLEYVIKRDLLLLENQLPFFVLDGLYNIAFSSDDMSLPPLLDLACEVLLEGQKEVLEKLGDGGEVLHLVDFVRTAYLPSEVRDQVNSCVDDGVNDHSWVFPPGVCDLYDAGVKFRTAKNLPLLDIKFDNKGVLTIPTLEVEDHTASLLLNLSAFEQCHYHFDSYIVDYVVFIDILISTLKDVEILMSNGIVSNYLGSSEDVADLFNTICSGTSYQAKGYYYTDVCKRLSSYSRAPWNRWRATLSHDYFGNPWTIISVIVAIVLLILTVIQTICTVVSMS